MKTRMSRFASSRTSVRLVAAVALAAVLLGAPAARACRLFGIVGDAVPRGEGGDLDTFLDRLGPMAEPLGLTSWGALWLPQPDVPLITIPEFPRPPWVFRVLGPAWRSSPAPAETPEFHDLHQVAIARGVQTKTLMVHFRLASSGCSAVPDPHPFLHDVAGREWAFEHNGWFDIDQLIRAGEDYDRGRFEAFMARLGCGTYTPRAGREAYGHCDADCIDSEVLFVNLKMRMEDAPCVEAAVWDLYADLLAAFRDATGRPDALFTSVVNLLLTDGTAMVAAHFAGWSTVHDRYNLHFLEDPAGRYRAVSSEPLSDGAWQDVPDRTLLVFSAAERFRPAGMDPTRDPRPVCAKARVPDPVAPAPKVPVTSK